ncbi:UDP-glycosyltransferase 88B1-like [Vitis riparia]|uniref:UDP-glycosyltransferase 88B1-like n=1 Tax=Vitis riparia TaxID=96939 RepID=UPI00155AFF08|nr:UDP-glycosyltransferase 88B1-like [Vitis riparia]
MESVVLYPSPGIGHLIAMVELGKLILRHHPSLSIVIFFLDPPFNTGATAPYISAVSSTTPSITFRHLPIPTLPQHLSSYPSFEALIFDLLTLSNPNIHQALQSISNTSTVLALVIDMFCTPALDVAGELNVPVYYFFTSSCSGLALFLYFPTLHQNITQSFKDMNTLHQAPGLPPIPSEDMPTPVLDRTSKAYESFVYHTTHITKSAGIIVNSFESLESKAVKAIKDGLCVRDRPTPQLFSIGPLIATQSGEGGGDGKECLKWLDSQPKRSVVFLCFGSMGFFSEEQLKEIAVGLETSGRRFLWVVRSPPSKDQSRRFLAPPDPDLDSLLPDGFLDRTKERGLVMKSWAPQVAVLSHGSVGGFVTHCGWNSVLEAISSGVPMVAWPLYAEQRLNKVMMVKEMKIALPMESSAAGLVTSTELEKRVRELMETEKGFSIRNRITAMKDEAKAAMSDGGSSLADLDKLIKSWRQKMNHIS